MGFLFLLLIALFLFAIVQMMKLSIRIEHLRTGEKGDPKSVWWELMKQTSNHALPGPFFSEFNDTDEIRELIGKRNKIVALFWGGILISVILAFVFKPEVK